MLAGCTADEQSWIESAQVPVQLSVSQDVSGDVTRTTSNLHTATSGFAVDETMKIFMKTSSGTSSQVYKVASVSSGKATLTDNGTKLYYPTGTSGSVQLYAVYPSDITQSSSHTVAYDQTGDANYRSSDLMYSAAKTVNLSDKTTQQTLNNFEHQMVRLKLNIIKASNVTSVTKVVMNNVKRKVTVSTLNESGITLNAAVQATGETSGTGNNLNEIQIFSGTNSSTSQQTYYVVFPKQVASGNDWDGTNFITVTADGSSVNYQLTKAFTAGSQYELTLNINAAALNNTVAITGWTDTQSATVNPTVTIESGGYGVVPDLFSVSSSTKVLFSQGNLQATYDGSSWSWAFAPHQWSYIGNAVANTKVGTNGLQDGKTGTVDLFGWVGASSTTLTSAPAMYGISNSTTTSDYGSSTSDALKSDWGTLIGSGWRTLTSTEWAYLFNSRSASTVNGTANARYAKAKVNNVQGVILFPDVYTHPAGVTAPTGINATGNTGWTGNSYSSDDWTKMESAGCVFLPAAGYRYGSAVHLAGSNGYWSSTPYPSGANYAYYVLFSSNSLNPASSSYRYNGYSVRLVRPVNYYAPALGDKYYSDGTWGNNTHASGATVIGVVAWLGSDSDLACGKSHGLVMALNDCSSTQVWGGYGNDESFLTNTSSIDGCRSNNKNGLDNTQKLNGGTGGCSHGHAAANAAASYTSEAPTSNGATSWFLPSAAQWLAVLGPDGIGKQTTAEQVWGSWYDADQTAYTNIKNALTATGVGGTALQYSPYWSSSEYDSSCAVYVLFDSSYGVLVDLSSKGSTFSVRAFLAF